MPLTIEVKNQQKQIPLKTAAIISITKKVLQFLNVRKAELSLAFVTDGKIRRLNEKFLGREHATDVLAFDLTPAELSRSGRKIKELKGEIVISAATVSRNARTFGTTPREELILCIVHGLLHLLGYDDHKALDVKKMRNKEQTILKRLKK